MRTSFHHQPEAQHPKIFSYHEAGPADYPIFQGQSGSHMLALSFSGFDPKPARLTERPHAAKTRRLLPAASYDTI